MTHNNTNNNLNLKKSEMCSVNNKITRKKGKKCNVRSENYYIIYLLINSLQKS